MQETDKPTFEEIFRQNERRIHYHMHKLGIHDRQGEFYVEGIYAMWMAYRRYDPNKGALATYFNYVIRHRLMDKLRKQNRQLSVDVGRTQPVMWLKEDAADDAFWERVRSILTFNQWKWV
ncbi:hypothetical protein GCM10008983_01500 [Lentibacillus halophilus]|uniref:RNA polymerase sigma-70 region 2 domain-containing protein n=1 Tax=Lentibacillus halophilus TaxID=295065 RepID=A0ABN0Z1J1_9BACI